MTPCTRTCALRAALTATAAAALLVVPLGTPAAAAPATTLELLAKADLWPYTLTTTSATVCARGFVDHGATLAGQWVFEVLGPTATYVTPGSGAVFPTTCRSFTTYAAPAGTTDAAIRFVGVGGDALASCIAVLVWAPNVPLTWTAYDCFNEPSAP